ncbi:AraC family transcriptional regulator [Paenibacillus doosanensis]|uniref:Bifunctional transcriptional activator/DNA repair enzyme AdaA n=1 Tax=Paenibacillus konkukensis TaxID=2020716 RepID=A0ABY4RV62_9BACL|nr:MULTISPECIES: AraC family transcriptional regulator [Paenibacillus]MCS7461246.1 AraC family transcriptional regulator [Paenibacillus doosanensis]UQZ85312.1 Bifunctional transcriptional activator/DNA repair enzyme AdaA [Paenibacillus konkukensis]
MKIMNYMNLNQHPVQLSFARDRTHEFVEIFHAHQGMEMLYVHEGHGSVLVNQQIRKLAPGSLVYFRPFQLHRIQMKLGPDAPYIRSLFVFEPTELERFLAPFASLQAFFHRLWKEPVGNPVFSGLPQERMAHLLSDYRQRLAEAPPDLLLEEQMLFLVALMHELKRHAAAEEQAPLPVKQKSTGAEQVMEWIEEHYMEEFHLEELAKAVHLSPNHVSAMFRQSAGTSITEYLTARRIRQACWLLRTSDQTVQEVGRSIGLSNFPYFCQLFKKHVGLTPYRYKRSSAGQ